jgi:hypothetical protein
MSSGILIEPWYPAPELRTVRHQVNNLLAPVTVAAELLEDGSDVSAMLQRSADRIRRVSTRLAVLVRPGEPDVAPFAAAQLFDDVSPSEVLLQADQARLTERLVGELLANGATLSGTVETLRDQGREVSFFCVRSVVENSDLTEEELHRLAVPLTMRGGGLGLAIAALETHLHGGRVRIPGPTGVLDFLLPLN